MKKIKALSALFMLFTALAFTSCETEPVDSELVGNNPNPENPNNPNNPGNPSNPGTSTGDYWPLAVGNQWVFVNGEGEETPTTINSTEVINGITYYRVDGSFSNSGTSNLSGEATSFIRNNNGDYRTRINVNIPATPGMPEITVSPYEYTIFKDYLEVGQSWTESVVQTTNFNMPGVPTVNANIDFEGVVLERDVTATVNGVSYDNVIKIKFTQTHTVQGTTTTTVTYLWFAKDVGPIQSVSENLGAEFVSYLSDYTLN